MAKEGLKLRQYDPVIVHYPLLAWEGKLSVFMRLLVLDFQIHNGMQSSLQIHLLLNQLKIDTSDADSMA